MGQDHVSRGVSVLCWLAAPVAMFHGNSVIRSKSVLKSSSVISSQIRVMWTGGTLWIFGNNVKDQGLLWRTSLLNRVDMLQSIIWAQVWNLMLKLWTMRGWSHFFWFWVSMSRSTSVLCLWKLLGTIQTSFVQPLSISRHKLLMIGGGVLLILGHLVKG